MPPEVPRPGQQLRGGPPGWNWDGSPNQSEENVAVVKAIAIDVMPRERQDKGLRGKQTVRSVARRV